jgi:site-specific DNA-cytosine methylase
MSNSHGNTTGGYTPHKIAVAEAIKEHNQNARHQQDLVQCSTEICRTIPAGTHGSTPHLLKTVVKHSPLRIRKLTPKECWRLMDFTDEDFEKAAQVNSNTQLYKQAGNSIIRNVLVAILGQLIEGKENAYRKL